MDVEQINTILNTPIVTTIIGGLLGALVTFYFMRKQRKDEEKREIQKFETGREMLVIEIYDNLERFIKRNETGFENYKFKTFYWEKYQEDLHRFYPKLFEDYLFYYQTMMGTINHSITNTFKVIAVGYNLAGRLQKPNDKYVELSLLFHPRYRKECKEKQKAHN